jgi:hypothetical protein
VVDEQDGNTSLILNALETADEMADILGTILVVPCHGTPHCIDDHETNSLTRTFLQVADGVDQQPLTLVAGICLTELDWRAHASKPLTERSHDAL